MCIRYKSRVDNKRNYVDDYINVRYSFWFVFLFGFLRSESQFLVEVYMFWSFHIELPLSTLFIDSQT